MGNLIAELPPKISSLSFVMNLQKEWYLNFQSRWDALLVCSCISISFSVQKQLYCMLHANNFQKARACLISTFIKVEISV